MVGYRDELYVFGGEVGFSNALETPLWIYSIKVRANHSYWDQITQICAISERHLEKAFVPKGRGDPQRSPLAHCHRLSGLHVHLRRVPRPQGVLP